MKRIICWLRGHSWRWVGHSLPMSDPLPVTTPRGVIWGASGGSSLYVVVTRRCSRCGKESTVKERWD